MIIKSIDEAGVLKTYGKFAAILSCLLLFSCAAGQLKQDVEPVAEVKASPPLKATGYIELDADIESNFLLAVDLIGNGEYGMAVKTLKSVIKREQRLIAPYINIAIAYRKIGDTEQAEKNLLIALQMDPAHPVANNELGLIYRKIGKFKEARAAYQLVTLNHPEFQAAKINLGVLCDLYIHDFECALEQFERYLEMNPDDKKVAIWIADVKRRVRQ